MGWGLRRILKTVVKNDRRLRESLPLGFEREEGSRQAAIARLKEQLAALPDQVDAVAVIEDAAEAARRGTPPSLDGHLADLVSAGSIDQLTRLRRRPGIDCNLRENDEHVCLRFHGKEVRLPAHVAPVIRVILKGDPFSLTNLPGELNEAERLVLAKCLVTEGLLTFAP
jgi:bifunctional lysine-specific demethylase and histidyl-hydroxylase NO66